MRMLLIHAERFEYSVRERALPSAEELDGLKPQLSLDNALVAFVTVEEGDEGNLPSVSERACDEIVEVHRRVGASAVVVYPYAHLSNRLASSAKALEALKAVERGLRARGVEVYRAPFGWYKEFMIRCYGHPLAEVFKVIEPSQAKAAPQPPSREERAREYAILTPSGELLPVSEYERFESELFRALVEREVLKKPAAGGRPRYLDYCKKFGIEWEPMSDLGHMRFSPEALVMVNAVAEYSWRCANELGIPVLRVKGTNMFDLSVPAVKQHAELYGDRLYEIRVGGKSLILRYAACHQQFAMMKDWLISYRHLPLGVFELADSYRLEQPGELLLCFRLRKFTMPDLHILCRDLEEAKEVSLKVHEKIYEEIKKLGHDYVSIYNTTRSFLEGNRDFLAKLVEMEGKPALVHFVEEGKYYWVLNVEYNIIDVLGRPREIGTFQIDVGNAERFNITYVDERGERHHPVIIHTALIGSIERYIYATLDKAARMEAEGRPPRLPTWLSPIQVRVIPVTRDYLEYAEAVASELERAGIRADVDDRDETLARRVRDAEVKWVPYVVVVGKREVESGLLSVRVRGEGEAKMTVEELRDRVLGELEGYPKVPLYMPRRVSDRPAF